MASVTQSMGLTITKGTMLNRSSPGLLHVPCLAAKLTRKKPEDLGDVEEASDGVPPQLFVKIATPVPNPVPVLDLADDAEQVCQPMVLTMTQDEYARAEEARHLADAQMFVSTQVRHTPVNLSSFHQNLLLRGIACHTITV